MARKLVVFALFVAFSLIAAAAQNPVGTLKCFNNDTGGQIGSPLSLNGTQTNPVSVDPGSGLAPGTYNVICKFTGTPPFLNSQSAVMQLTVTSANQSTTTTLNSMSPNPSIQGQDVAASLSVTAP